MSSKEERNRNCEPRVCFESDSSMMNHLSVKSYISSVSKNLCLSFTPQSQSPEENMGVKEHGGMAVVGLSEVTWEVNLINLTGFRISQEAHFLGVTLRCLQRGLSEEGNSTLNVGSFMPQNRIPDQIMRRKRGKPDEHQRSSLSPS